MFLDKDWESPHEVTLVTALLDIDRKDRNFFNHYVMGLKEILKCRNPIVVYAEQEYHQRILDMRGDLPIQVRQFSKEMVENYTPFKRIQNIITNENWINQSAWMKNSVICNPYYIPLTHSKIKLLDCVSIDNPFNSSRFFWVDSGMYHSYGITEHIDTFNFNRIPYDRLFLTSYPYYTDSEIHGYDIKVMEELTQYKPNHVCRATLFGGNRNVIEDLVKDFHYSVRRSLEHNAIGTEEAIFTLMSLSNGSRIFCPMTIFSMPTGDIKNYLNTIRSR